MFCSPSCSLHTTRVQLLIQYVSNAQRYPVNVLINLPKSEYREDHIAKQKPHSAKTQQKSCLIGLPTVQNSTRKTFRPFVNFVEYQSIFCHQMWIFFCSLSRVRVRMGNLSNAFISLRCGGPLSEHLNCPGVTLPADRLYSFVTY